MRQIIVPSILLLAGMPRFAVAGLPQPVEQFLQQNCHKCHDADVQKGGLDVTGLALDPAKPETLNRWVQVFDRVKAGEMPPKRQPRPEAEAQKAFLTALGDQLRSADLQRIATHG